MTKMPNIHPGEVLSEEFLEEERKLIDKELKSIKPFSAPAQNAI